MKKPFSSNTFFSLPLQWFYLTIIMDNQFIYSKGAIEFVTVAAETCLFLEKSSELSKEEFVIKSIKILPLLYLKSTIIDKGDLEPEDETERFVTEEDYLYVKRQIELMLGLDDVFLETFHPDMPYSDTPIASFISENLADVYQELKDLTANYQLEDVAIMENALYACLQTFEEHWGQKLLNALRALHAIRFKETFGLVEEDEKFNNDNYRKLDKESFFRFQTDDNE